MTLGEGVGQEASPAMLSRLFIEPRRKPCLVSTNVGDSNDRPFSITLFMAEVQLAMPVFSVSGISMVVS
jgi:hypothetical protein